MQYQLALLAHRHYDDVLNEFALAVFQLEAAIPNDAFTARFESPHTVEVLRQVFERCRLTRESTYNHHVATHPSPAVRHNPPSDPDMSRRNPEHSYYTPAPPRDDTYPQIGFDNHPEPLPAATHYTSRYRAEADSSQTQPFAHVQHMAQRPAPSSSATRTETPSQNEFSLTQIDNASTSDEYSNTFDEMSVDQGPAPRAFVPLGTRFFSPTPEQAPDASRSVPPPSRPVQASVFHPVVRTSTPRPSPANQAGPEVPWRRAEASADSKTSYSFPSPQAPPVRDPRRAFDPPATPAQGMSFEDYQRAQASLFSGPPYVAPGTSSYYGTAPPAKVQPTSPAPLPPVAPASLSEGQRAALASASQRMASLTGGPGNSSGGNGAPNPSMGPPSGPASQQYAPSQSSGVAGDAGPPTGAQGGDAGTQNGGPRA